MVESDSAFENNSTPSTESTGELKQRNLTNGNGVHKQTTPKKQEQEPVSWTIRDLNWKNVLFFGYLHLGSIYALYSIFSGQAKILTSLFAILLINFGLLGITAGAHRCWSHKAYKAKWPLKLILTFFNTIAHQNGIWVWVLDHRVHHKYQDTHADPHNAGRGLFFSHMGWLMLNERPEVDEKRKTIDMSDCIADPFVMIQKKYYWIIMPIISIAWPIWTCQYFWGETFSNAYHIVFVLRYLYTLHDTFLINSYAHHTGTKPYDKTIRPTDYPLLAVMTLGEGWHNYHHVFPWDYKTAELGNYRYNVTTAFIDFFARIGWAYDLKSVSDDVIQKRMARIGDGDVSYSRQTLESIAKAEIVQESIEGENLIWGWDDSDMTKEHKEMANIINKTD